MIFFQLECEVSSKHTNYRLDRIIKMWDSGCYMFTDALFKSATRILLREGA